MPLEIPTSAKMAVEIRSTWGATIKANVARLCMLCQRAIKREAADGEGNNVGKQLAFAQETPASGAAGQAGQTATTTEQTATSSATIQGCLTATSGNYMLTDANGMMYQLEGDESQLSANLNKEVEATGAVGSKASASATNNPEANAPSATQGEATASAGRATGAASGTVQATASKTLEVTSIRKIANTCSSTK